MVNCLRFVTTRRWLPPRIARLLQDKVSFMLTPAFPNEEAIILRDVSNGRGTMNPVTTFCPGWWLKANDPPPSFPPPSFFPGVFEPACSHLSSLSPLFRLEFNSREFGVRWNGVWFSTDTLCIFESRALWKFVVFVKLKNRWNRLAEIIYFLGIAHFLKINIKLNIWIKI